MHPPGSTVIDPNHFVPDGILGSRSYDNVPLPANLETPVDLMPYTGLDVRLTGNEIKAIQDSQRRGAQARLGHEEDGAARWAMCRHQGLLTETHAIRVAELQAVAGVPLVCRHRPFDPAQPASEGPKACCCRWKTAS